MKKPAGLDWRVVLSLNAYSVLSTGGTQRSRRQVPSLEKSPVLTTVHVVTPTHRCSGLYLTYEQVLRELQAEVISSAVSAGSPQGRGMPAKKTPKKK